MNEKFFDLKKEKQDRMINAGLRIFSLNGYHHASTDDIVKEAHISKGLLFHYFGSKSGYYAFLYDYITRFTILELNSELKLTSLDYFDLEEELLRVESDLMEQYPFIYLFLESVKLEDDGEGLACLDTPEKDVTEYYAELYAKADISQYVHIEDAAQLTDIVHYVKIGVMRELLLDRTNPISLYTGKVDRYVKAIRQLASTL